MADFETKLRWLSERGRPVGAEELIERIEAALAGDPLVVVAKRREGTLMTKTQQPPTTKQPNRYRGPAWAVAAFVAVLAVAAGLFLAFAGDDTDVAGTTPPPTTVAPDVESMTDLEVIEAGVAAFYSGDAERAAELFELPDRTDDQIRAESAYQAAIGGRLTLNCNEGAPGSFTCTTPYHNAMTDAINHFDNGDTNRVVVEDGVITEFAFPEHSWIVIEMGAFLVGAGRFDGYQDCGYGPFAESCATIQLENLDAWVEGRADLDPVGLVDFALASWYGGDCEAARFFTAGESCSTPSTASQTMEYHSILEAQVSVENCEATAVTSDGTVLSCEVHYSNVMYRAVGEPPSVNTREFDVWDFGLVMEPGGALIPWYEGYPGDYPEDRALFESFTFFADDGELADEYASECDANRHSPECANFILGNLDDFAAWYETNG